MMAQTRRYPNNVLPSYATNHNGTSERVEEREKAKIARKQNVDSDRNKKPLYPLFPSPRRVKENNDDDGISAIIKNVLGDFTKFKRIKNPGITCVGVLPTPPTPTESHTQDFDTEDKPVEDLLPNGKPILSSRAPEKPQEARIIEKQAPKSKVNVDPSKHKTNKPGNKHNFIDNKAKEQKAKDSAEVKPEIKNPQTKESKAVEKIKNSQATELLCGNSKKTDTCAKTSGDITPIKSKNAVKDPEDNSKAPHQELTDKRKLDLPIPAPKSRPTHIQIPSRDSGSISDIQSPCHSDMKVHNILKEMTEPVTVPPLTGICTPVPKLDCRFPFPSNANEKDVSEVSDGKHSLRNDLELTDDDSEDEQDHVDLPDSGRVDGQSRSRSSSSSSSSSSDESGSESSSDSECEDVPNDKKWNTGQKQSQLNARSPTVPAPPGTLAMSTPKNKDSETLEGIERLLPNSTSPCATSSPNEILEKLPTELDSSRSLPDLGRDPFLNSGVDRIDAGISEEQELIGEPFGCKDRTLKSGDQTNSKSVNSTSLFRESTHHDDTKIKTEPEQSRDEFLGVKLKTESPKCQIKLEIKEDRVIKEDAVDDAKLGKSESLNLGINKLKEEKSVNETQKHEKPKEKKNEKEQFEGKKNVSKPKLEDTSVPKKNKRKVKERKERKESEKGFHLKKAVETSSSNHSNITKPLNKEVEDSDKKDRLTFDTHSDDAEEEESLIDVVGDESPVVKKKKRKEEGLKREKRNDANGHTKNGYSDIPLDIQVVRDDDKEPKSLLVRIDLSLLQRIPKKAVGNDEIAVGSIPAEEEFSSISNADKRKAKKKELKGDNVEKDAKRTKNGYTKRSPSWDNDHHSNKRVRRDSDREKNPPAYKSDRHRSRKSVAEQNAEVEEDIKKVNPDTHLQKAKTLKREADKLADKEAKSRTYVEAVVRFICCGRALEDKDETEPRAGQMYSETTELLRFILKHVLGKSVDKRLFILCLRMQSILLHKLYRMKSKQAIRNSQTLAEYFKATQKNNMTSPYTASNKPGSTPSPMSPTPSPAGSVGSIGSSSSNSSGEGNPASSQNGRPQTSGANSSMTSPVSVSIPQRIHTVMSQHVSTTSKLLHSVDIWDKADNLMTEYQEFFSTVDSFCGALTFHSSIAQLVNYVKRTLSKLHDRGEVET